MIRTQISLEREEYLAAKKAAKKLGVSLAELLRRGLRLAIPVDKKSPWMAFCGMVETGNPNSSLSVDDIVYGQKD